MIEPKRQNLGRGLSALLGNDVAEAPKSNAPATLPIEYLRPGKFQPRRHIDAAGLDELSQSIREKGILQPILVRRLAGDANAYEIVAGERRWRAAQAAQLHEVPVVVRELSDTEALEIALVENLQRQDLSPLDEASGYRRLMDEFAHTQEDLAKVLGKSRSHVANMMRLLALPEVVKSLLDAGTLSAGHARALLGAKDPGLLAKKIVARGLNVRQTERLVQRERGSRRGKPAAGKDADTVALERDLATILGLRVDIRYADGEGTLTLHYKTLEQLDDILHRLKHVHEAASPFDPVDDNDGSSGPR